MRFGFFPLTPFSGNLGNEYLLAASLAAKGDQVFLIACDGRDRCFTLAAHAPALDRTARCESCSNGVKALYRHSLGGYGDLAKGAAMSQLLSTAGDRQLALHQAIDALADEALADFTYETMPLGAWVQNNLRTEYGGEHWQRLPDIARRIRAWLKGAVDTALATEQFLQRARPDCLVILNGVPVNERTAVATAKRLGTRAITYECGVRAGTMVLREESPACFWDFGPEWGAWRTAPLTLAESHALDGYLHRRWLQSSKADHVYSTAATGDAAQVRDRLGLSPDRPMLLAFTNVLGDTSIFNAQRAFDSLTAWLRALLDYAALHPELDLVIRIHPAEANVRRWHEGQTWSAADQAEDMIAEICPTLPANVRIVGSTDPLSSYDLLPLARVALVYVTTVGMEAAAMGVPVIAAGKNYYTDAGFVWPLQRREEFEPMLDRLMTRPELPPNSVELARRFIYFMFWRACIDVPEVVPMMAFDRGEKLGELIAQTFTDIPQMAANPSAGLSHLLRVLRNEAPYLAPPASWRPVDQGEALPLASPERPMLLLWPGEAGTTTLSQSWQAVLTEVPAKGIVRLIVAEDDVTQAETWQRDLAGWDVIPTVADQAILQRLVTKALALIVVEGKVSPELAELARLAGLTILTSPTEQGERLSQLLDPTIEKDLRALCREAT